MTISSTTRKTILNGNDVATSFPFAFKVFSSSELLVVLTDADGIETELTLNSNYSVSLNADQDANPGGSVTYPLTGDPLATGEKLTLASAIERLQESVDLQNGGGFYPSVIEAAFDRLVIMVQEITERLERTFYAPVSDASITTELPTASLRANNYLAFDADGNPIAAASVGNATVSAFMATVLDDSTAAAARTTLGALGTTEALLLTGGTLSGPINEAEGAAIASASTVNLDSATGNLVHVTGTTTITAVTLAQGSARTVVFDSALTLTHGASLILPGAANITTAAGDVAIFRGEGSSVTRCVGYEKASGKAVIETLKVVQSVVVSTATADSTTTQMPADNTKPQITEGKQLLSQAFTPLYADSNIEIDVSIGGISVSGAAYACAAVFDGNADSIAAGVLYFGSSETRGLSFSFKVSAGSTSARTYSLRYGPGSGVTMYVCGNNGGSAIFNGLCVSSMSIREVRP